MDKIDYIKIESLPYILKEQMRKAEKALIKNDFCSNKQLCEVLSVKERQVQKIIQQLNECYGQANHISLGRKHCLQHREENLAFPESNYFDPSDKDLLNDILKLASIFDGSIPLKSILSIYHLKGNDLSFPRKS